MKPNSKLNELVIGSLKPRVAVFFPLYRFFIPLPFKGATRRCSNRGGACASEQRTTHLDQLSMTIITYESSDTQLALKCIND